MHSTRLLRSRISHSIELLKNITYALASFRQWNIVYIRTDSYIDTESNEEKAVSERVNVWALGAREPLRDKLNKLRT